MLSHQDINLNVAYSNEVELQTRTIRSVLTKVYSLRGQHNGILKSLQMLPTRVHYFTTSTNYEKRNLPPRKSTV